MNYYYIGGASGSLATANDWSLTEGGDPLDTLTLADGDAFYIASDATIALSGTSATLAVKLVLAANVSLTGATSYLSGIEIAAGKTLNTAVSLYITGLSNRYFTATLGTNASIVFSGTATWIVNGGAFSNRTSTDSVPYVDFTGCAPTADFGILTLGEAPKGSPESANYYLGTASTPFPLPPCRIAQLIFNHGGLP